MPVLNKKTQYTPTTEPYWKQYKHSFMDFLMLLARRDIILLLYINILPECDNNTTKADHLILIYHIVNLNVKKNIVGVFFYIANIKHCNYVDL